METRVVAKVVLVGPDDKVLLLRRSESDTRRPNEFDIPGGHTDGNEYPHEAAARETREETGMIVDPRGLELVYSEAKVVEADLNVVWLFFVGRTSAADVKLSAEHSEYRWVPLRQAVDLLDYDRQKRALSHVADAGLIGG
jgi:8-oxo-dGTP pyrophosphatase MutT (NUDIX family)